MLKKLLLIIMIITLTGCHSLNQAFGMKDDNPVEEVVEQVVERETGVHLDLTPDSPIPEKTLPCDQVQVPFTLGPV